MIKKIVKKVINTTKNPILFVLTTITINILLALEIVLLKVIVDFILTFI